MKKKTPRPIDHDEVLHVLQMEIETSSIRKTASRLGVSAPYLSDVMLGRRTVGPKLADALGLRREVVIHKVITFFEV